MPNQTTLSHAELLQLKRWNTPTIYNGWEQITKHDSTVDAFNLEPTRDFMPQIVAEGFYIAGKDKEFKHGRARIQGSQLVVWHEEIKEPWRTPDQGCLGEAVPGRAHKG